MKITGQLIVIFFVFLCLTFFIQCDGNEKKELQETDDVDIVTRATPNGGELRSADNSPVRSALGQPNIELTNFKLEITGLVDSAYSLTWEEIQNLPAVYTDTMIMYCVEGWEVWGVWKGILVKDLLAKAHIQFDGEYVMFRSLDGYSTSLSIPYMEKYGAILAYEVNGEPLQEHDGFPLRLIAFGKFGYKWVNKMEVIEYSAFGYWEKLGESNRADVPLERRKYYEGEDAKPLVYFPRY